MKAKVLFLAAATIALTVACNNKKAEPVDTMPADTLDIEMVAEEVEDTVAVVEEAAATPAPAKKVETKEAKKAPVAPTVNADGTKTVATGKVERKTAAKEEAAPVAAVANNDGTKTVATGKVKRKTAKAE